MKSSLSRSLQPSLAVLLGCTVSILSAGLAWANPNGESVSAGTAVFERDGSTLRIKTGSRTVIDWQGFSIGVGETTRFLQPSSKDVTLNRVVGADGSSIFGSLQSNGQIILLNPNGILIGSTGKVDAAGFTATTLNLTNEAFLRGGDLNFIGDSQAGVVNRGAIHAIDGDVFLIGRSIENSGKIEALRGTVGLGAGTEVLIKQSGDERVFVKPGTADGTGITNSGAIAAITAELKAHGNPYALAINNGGTISANGFSRQGGRVLLTANNGIIRNSGTLMARNSNQSGGRIQVNAGAGDSSNTGLIDASGKSAGAIGGEVRLLGNRVAVGDSGRVDVSGDAGGGTALIGGDYHGGNSLVQNATQTLVSPDASITADAISRGNGGRVIIWSDDTTRYAGSIRAKGGQLGGNGGFVEVSGKGNLQFLGQVQTGAVKGKDGTLLMDPEDITITTSGTYNVQLLSSLPSAEGVGLALGGTDESFYISPSVLQAIQGNIILQANRDITLESGATLNLVNQTVGERLVMQAGRHISLNSAITTAGADIYLEADRAGDPTDPGKLTINSPISTANGGFIQLIAANFDINSPVNSGKSRSTRIAPSHGGDLTIGGTGATLTAGDLDMLTSTYQVWVGKAYSAGDDGLGGINTPGIGDSEITAGTLNFNATSETHSRAPMQYFGSGDINVNASLTTHGKINFTNLSGTLYTFTVADGATFTNGSGGLELEGYDVDLQSSGAIHSKLTVGSNVGAFPIYLGDGGIAGSISISGAELQRVTAPQLNLYAYGADITVDNVTDTNSAQVTSVSLAAGAANGGGTGAVHFVNNPSTFNKLTVAANGGIDIGAALTVKTGAVNLYADRFSANTGTFSNTAAVISTANQPIFIEASDVDIQAALTGTGAVTLQAANATRSIGIGGGAGSFNVSQAEIDLIGSTHTSLTIGRNSSQNVMEVANAAFGLPVTLQSQTIRLTGSLGVSGGQYALNIKGGVLLGGNAVIDNAAGNILFASTVQDTTTGAHSLQVSAEAGTVTFQGAIGSGTNGAPGALTVSAAGNVSFKGGTWLGGNSSITSGSNVLFASTLNDVTNGGSSLTLDAPAGNVVFQGAVGTGTSGLGVLGVTANGDVSFKGAAALAANTKITSGTGSILFASSLKASNTALPTLTLKAPGGNVTIQGAIGSGSNVFGALTVSAGQSASLKGAMLLGASASVTTGGGAILIGSSVNDLVSGVGSLNLDAGGGAITLNSVGTGKLQALNSLNTSNAGSIILNGSITTSGSQTYSGPVQLNNAITLTTSGGNLVFQSTLDSKPAAPKALTITTGTLGLGGVSFGGDVGGSSSLASLQITTSADFTSSSVFNVAGALKIATLGDISLNEDTNNFASLNLTAHNASVAKSGTLSLSGASISGGLSLNTSGPIVETGAIKVAGASSFNGSSVILGNAGNSFTNSINLSSAGNVTLVNSIATVLGDSTVGGALTVTSKGVTTQSGALNVTGLAKFVATGSGTNGAITLPLANSFGSLQLTAVNASVTESDSMSMGASTVTQGLALNAAGAITQTGPLSVSGTFSATSGGAITLDNTSNAFAVIGDITRGGALSLLDSKSTLILAGSITGGTTSNNVTIIANAGNLTIAGPARTAIAGQVITLVTPFTFTNGAGANALNPVSGGRYLIYARYPSPLGGLVPNWFETFVSYPTAPASSTGNGFLSNN